MNSFILFLWLAQTEKSLPWCSLVFPELSVSYWYLPVFCLQPFPYGFGHLSSCIVEDIRSKAFQGTTSMSSWKCHSDVQYANACMLHPPNWLKLAHLSNLSAMLISVHPEALSGRGSSLLNMYMLCFSAWSRDSIDMPRSLHVRTGLSNFWAAESTCHGPLCCAGAPFPAHPHCMAWPERPLSLSLPPLVCT